MSNQGSGPEHTIEQYEVVGPRVAADPPRSRRYVAALGAAVVAAAAVGGGMWAWRSWTKQGPQPAQALPANTLAYAALDLDPPGEQKVAAYRTLRKFPTLKKDLGLGSTDDLRQSIVDQVGDGAGCKLAFKDIKSWMGERIAFAVVAQDKPEPVVVVQVKDAAQARAGLKAASAACNADHLGYSVDGDWAVLARDESVAARVARDASAKSLADDGDFRSLTKAAGDPGLATLYAAPAAGKALLDAIDRNPWLGFTVSSGIAGVLDPVASIVTGLAMSTVVTSSFDEGSASSTDEVLGDLTPKQRRAQASLDKLQKRFEHYDELSKPEQKRLEREQRRLLDQLFPREHLDGSLQDGDDHGIVIRPGENPDATGGTDGTDGTDGYGSFDEISGPEVNPALRTSLEHFTGVGGVVRFAGGALEAEVTGDALEGTFADAYGGSAGDDLASALPANSAIAFGAGLGDKWVDALMSQLSGAYPFTEDAGTDTEAAFEKATGLDVPGDLEALGGSGFAIVAGSGFDPDRLSGDPARTPVAVRIHGDADRVEAALAKLRTGIGTEDAARILSRRVGGDVVVGPDADYLDELAKKGADLGDSARFKDVTPDAKDATTVLFADFDAGDWLARSAPAGDRSDAKPLDTLGMTVTKHDGQQHILLRLTFD